MQKTMSTVERADDDPAQRLVAYIADTEIDAEIVFPDGPSSTVAEAAATLGVKTTQIVKSILFENRNGECLLVVASGERRINRQRAIEVSGLPGLQLASPETVLKMSGFPVGGMPPVGHHGRFSVIVDRRVMEEPVVFGGGGRTDAVVRILPADILRLNDACIAAVTEAAP